MSSAMLTRGNEVLIIDAKYYTHTTQTQYDVHTLHSTWYIAPSDRLQFRHLFGAGSDYSAEDIIRIAYGRSTLYEAPSAPAEDIEMQGMSL